MEECTFKPLVVSQPSFHKNYLQKPNSAETALQTDYSQLNTKAIEKYLERCNYAKQLKLEQELLELHKLGGHFLNGRSVDVSALSQAVQARSATPSQRSSVIAGNSAQRGHQRQPKQNGRGRKTNRKIRKGQLFVNGAHEDEKQEEDDAFDELSLDTIKEIDPIQEQSRNNTHKNLQQYPYQIVQQDVRLVNAD